MITMVTAMPIFFGGEPTASIRFGECLPGVYGERCGLEMRDGMHSDAEYVDISKGRIENRSN